MDRAAFQKPIIGVDCKLLNSQPRNQFDWAFQNQKFNKRPVEWTLEARRKGDMDFRRIPNEKLEKADVPDARAPWLEIEKFALTFDGYGAFPDEECANLANRVIDEFSKSAKILEKMKLMELRACLFLAQRRWHHSDWFPDADGKTYSGALLNLIRCRCASDPSCLSGGSIFHQR
jgi:hypothetical protein